MKEQLSHCIKQVREGEEYIILDRQKPVAVLRPYRAEDSSDERDSLVAEGLLRPAEESRSPSPLPPPIPQTGRSLSSYIEDERSER